MKSSKMEELNKKNIGSDLKKLLSAQKSFEEQQEQERQRIQKLNDQIRSEYYLKFAEKYRTIIKPCFDLFAVTFKEHGHELKLSYENLDEIHVRPEVQFDLHVNSDKHSSVPILIIGGGPKEEMVFYVSKHGNKFKEVFLFDQLSPKAIERMLINILSLPIR